MTLPSSHPGSGGFILTATCPDTAGLVAAVSAFLTERGGFIVESEQHGDPQTGLFFLRTTFIAAPGAALPTLDALREAFAPLAERFAMRWAITPSEARPKTIIAVSRFGHCLNDLLHRWRIGALPIDIVGVISNHPDLRELVEWHGIPFHHLPVVAVAKADQEARFLALIEESSTELVVLARYMQVLSDDMSRALAWRCINIHHSFLPSFKGAKPYHQAHARGVKLIGATAHYVTPDLDEGPIIEQDVERVDHRLSSEALADIGRDIEARVLARAVRWHAERKVLPNGNRTVVFR